MAHILLLEPDRVLASTYQKALHSAGYKVSVVSSAQAAIHAIDKKRPDLVISELQLADHNGVEFLYELRSYPEWQTIPVIVLSAVPEGEAGMNKQLQTKLGISQYCYKPTTSLQKLATVVKEVLAELVP